MGYLRVIYPELIFLRLNVRGCNAPLPGSLDNHALLEGLGYLVDMVELFRRFEKSSTFRGACLNGTRSKIASSQVDSCLLSHLAPHRPFFCSQITVEL